MPPWKKPPHTSRLIKKILLGVKMPDPRDYEYLRAFLDQLAGDMRLPPPVVPETESAPPVELSIRRSLRDYYVSWVARDEGLIPEFAGESGLFARIIYADTWHSISPTIQAIIGAKTAMLAAEEISAAIWSVDRLRNPVRLEQFVDLETQQTRRSREWAQGRPLGEEYTLQEWIRMELQPGLEEFNNFANDVIDAALDGRVIEPPFAVMDWWENVPFQVAVGHEVAEGLMECIIVLYNCIDQEAPPNQACDIPLFYLGAQMARYGLDFANPGASPPEVPPEGPWGFEHYFSHDQYSGQQELDAAIAQMENDMTTAFQAVSRTWWKKIENTLAVRGLWI